QLHQDRRACAAECRDDQRGELGLEGRAQSGTFPTDGRELDSRLVGQDSLDGNHKVTPKRQGGDGPVEAAKGGGVEVGVGRDVRAVVERDPPEAVTVVYQLDGDRGHPTAYDPAPDVERVIASAARLAPGGGSVAPEAG